MKRRFLQHSPKTVALVGMGPSITSMFNECLTQEFSPDWADEVWAINMAANLVRHDVVIWMDDIEDQEQFKPGLFACLRKWKSNVITTKANREILRNSYDYPIDEVTAIALPIFGKPYFNNGVAMAVAYAMAKGVTTLKLYGCDFTYPDRNYAESGRGCTEAWLALASASGMIISLPDKTSIFDAVENNKGVYGYKEQPIITLPDGRTYNPVDGSVAAKEPAKANPSPKKATKKSKKASPAYEPEDSSKKETKNVVQRSVPGTNGAAAPDGGPAPG